LIIDKKSKKMLEEKDGNLHTDDADDDEKEEEEEEEEEFEEGEKSGERKTTRSKFGRHNGKVTMISKKSTPKKKKSTRTLNFPERSFGKTLPENEFFNAQHLEELSSKGYTVIENVLNEADISRALELFYQWIEGLGTGIDRNNFMDPENQSKFAANKHGIIEYPPPMHSVPSWYIRSHPKVMQVFSEVWGVQPRDLITSFDRINISFKKEENKKEGKKEANGLLTPKWSHADQDSRLIGLQCIQGFVNIKNTDPKHGGGLFVLKGISIIY
jgi:hypothetical protein